MNAIRPIIAIALVMLTFTISSCKKEMPHAEVVSSHLQDLIKNERIDRVVAFENLESFDNIIFTGDYGARYSFENPFVNVEGEAWNLQYLKKYEIRVVNGITKYLGLYF
jgi:hypothetical protein